MNAAEMGNFAFSQAREARRTKIQDRVNGIKTTRGSVAEVAFNGTRSKSNGGFEKTKQMIKSAMNINLPERQVTSFSKKPSLIQTKINQQLLDFHSNDSALNRVVKT